MTFYFWNIKFWYKRNINTKEIKYYFFLAYENIQDNDIDALKIIANGINSLRSICRSFLIITHYQRLLEHIKPDFVHVLLDGSIVKTGCSELAEELDKIGYGNKKQL